MIIARDRTWCPKKGGADTHLEPQIAGTSVLSSRGAGEGDLGLGPHTSGKAHIWNPSSGEAESGGSQ